MPITLTPDPDKIEVEIVVGNPQSAYALKAKGFMKKDDLRFAIAKLQKKYNSLDDLLEPIPIVLYEHGFIIHDREGDIYPSSYIRVYTKLSHLTAIMEIGRKDQGGGKTVALVDGRGKTIGTAIVNMTTGEANAIIFPEMKNELLEDINEDKNIHN